MQGSVVLSVVLGVDCVDSSPALLLVCDDRRYLFDCGEGTQRLSGEYKQRMTKLEHVFLTRVAWPAIGGLPGVLAECLSGSRNILTLVQACC